LHRAFGSAAVKKRKKDGQAWEAPSVSGADRRSTCAPIDVRLADICKYHLTQVAAQGRWTLWEAKCRLFLVKALPVSRELTQIEILGALEAIGSRRASRSAAGIFLPYGSIRDAALYGIQALGKLGRPRRWI